ncbi:unnamed protein product [Closterium sp. NIES-64]|nr:unnamed protein product [Closterium sp. NIES-64]
MTLINHRGVGCEVDKDDFRSIEDDQWITDGVLDFHNVALAVKPAAVGRDHTSLDVHPPEPLLGVTVPAGADAWGDTSGHETVKAEEEEDLVSGTDDEEDGDDTCATKYTGFKLEKASGNFGVKIQIKVGGKRKQQQLGAYTSEEEAAFAYAAGAFVLRPRDKIPNTVSLSAVDKAMLRGCTKEDLQLLVEARRWWRWRSWREAREGVNWKLKRGRKRVVATRTSKRQRVVDSNNKAANKPDDPDNAESGGTAHVHNGSGGCARHNEAEEGVEDSVAHEKLADHPA